MTECNDNFELKEGFGYVACQNCGKPIWTRLPFYGCMFCNECSTPVTFASSFAGQANDEQFKQPFTIEEIREKSHSEYGEAWQKLADD